MVFFRFKSLFKSIFLLFLIAILPCSILAYPSSLGLQKDIGKCHTKSDIKALLYRYEKAAFDDIKGAFLGVSVQAWKKCQDLIARTHRTLLSQLQVDRQTSDLYVPYNGSDLIKFALQCIQKRGLKRNGIVISFDNQQECSASAGVQLILHSFKNDFCFKAAEIKDVNITINPRFWYNPKLHVTSQPHGALHTMHHEITHILEGHSIKGILIKATLKRHGYRESDIEKHPAILAYNRVHEYIADLIPCILNRRIAEYQYKEALLCKSGHLQIIGASPIHPTPLDLYPWLEAIVALG